MPRLRCSKRCPWMSAAALPPSLRFMLRWPATGKLPIPCWKFLRGLTRLVSWRKPRLLRTAPSLASPQGTSRLGNLGFVFLYIGAPNRALEYYEGMVESGGFTVGIIFFQLWH